MRRLVLDEGRRSRQGITLGRTATPKSVGPISCREAGAVTMIRYVSRISSWPVSAGAPLNRRIRETIPATLGGAAVIPQPFPT